MRERKAATTASVAVVPEYGTFAVDYNKNPDMLVSAMSVNKCLVLDIANKDSDNKRTSRSITHLTLSQARNKDVLSATLPSALEAFRSVGGDTETAEFRIFGGQEGFFKDELRENLKTALKENLGEQVEERIKEPKGYYLKAGESMDIFFERDSVTFWKEKAPATPFGKFETINCSNELKTRKAPDDDKIDSFLKERVNPTFLPNQSAIEAQTAKKVSDTDKVMKLYALTTFGSKEEGRDNIVDFVRGGMPPRYQSRVRDSHRDLFASEEFSSQSYNELVGYMLSNEVPRAVKDALVAHGFKKLKPTDKRFKQVCDVEKPAIVAETGIFADQQHVRSR